MAICSAILLNRSSFALVSATASSMLPRTVFASFSGGSWASRPTVYPGISRASPLLGRSSPAMMRSRLDFPAPFGPTTPILAPGRKLSVTSSRTTLSPCALRAFSSV